jgi:hypothetical protein
VLKMGVWPPEVGLQEQASNHLMLLHLKGVVVSDQEKAVKNRQVCDEKMSVSEPLMTHRKGFQTLSKRVVEGSTRTSSRATCQLLGRQPVCRRHELITGFSMERGNLARGEKENPQVATSVMRENTKTCDRGGAARSSEEAPVMGVERRGCVIRSGCTCQPQKVGGA